MSTNIVVTGASRGIGKGFVQQYLLRPSTIVIATARDPSSPEAQTLRHLPAAQGSKLILISFDATSETGASDAISTLFPSHGITHLDIIVANSGIFDTDAHHKVAEMNLAHLQHHIDVNAYGVIRLFQATWPLLQKSSKPIFMLNSAGAATMGGMKAFANFPLNSYSASKVLANFFILRLHMEYPGLIAFAIHPGSVATETRTAAARKIGASVTGMAVEESVGAILSIIDSATLKTTSGTFLNVDKTPIPW